MVGKRDYGQFCGLAVGLNVIGERWTLLVVRELLIGPARFNEILDNLPGMGPNLLAERLRMLTAQGVLDQLPVTGDGRGKLYQLSELGEQLRRPILDLARWGMQFLAESDTTGVVSAKWSFLAIQAMVMDDRIPDRDEAYEFRIGDEVFAVEVVDGAVTFLHGAATSSVLTITSDAASFIRIGARMITPFEALVTGDIKIEGEADAIQRCTHMLGLS